jgi:predicted kinase
MMIVLVGAPFAGPEGFVASDHVQPAVIALDDIACGRRWR